MTHASSLLRERARNSYVATLTKSCEILLLFRVKGLALSDEVLLVILLSFKLAEKLSVA